MGREIIISKMSYIRRMNNMVLNAEHCGTSHLIVFDADNVMYSDLEGSFFFLRHF